MAVFENTEVNPIEVIEVIAGTSFTLSSLIALGITKFSILGYSPTKTAPYIAILSLLIGYTGGEARDPTQLKDYETIIAATTVTILVSVKFIPQIKDLITQNQLYSVVAFCTVSLGYITMAVKN